MNFMKDNYIRGPGSHTFKGANNGSNTCIFYLYTCQEVNHNKVNHNKVNHNKIKVNHNKITKSTNQHKECFRDFDNAYSAPFYV